MLLHCTLFGFWDGNKIWLMILWMMNFITKSLCLFTMYMHSRCHWHCNDTVTVTVILSHSDCHYSYNVTYTVTACKRHSKTNSGHTISRLWTKVHEFLGRRRLPVLSHVRAQLSMSCFIQKIVDIKHRSRLNFLAQFFGRDDPDFSIRQVVSAIYCPQFGKVWLSSVCWSPSAKPGNEIECRIHEWWVRTPVQL